MEKFHFFFFYPLSIPHYLTNFSQLNYKLLSASAILYSVFLRIRAQFSENGQHQYTNNTNTNDLVVPGQLIWSTTVPEYQHYQGRYVKLLLIFQ